jgi:hypothetical protein
MATYGTGSSIPQGWNYNAALDHYEGPNVETLEAYDVMKNGFVLAHAKKYTYSAPGSIGVTAQPPGSFPIASGATIQPRPQQTPNMVVSTKKGNVTANLETGELTFPPEVGKDHALREFWLGFQEHFQPVNKAQYEQKIKELQQEVEIQKVRVDMAYKVSAKEAATHVSDRVRKKYGNEKFIMIKPEDLIKFIEESTG